MIQTIHKLSFLTAPFLKLIPGLPDYQEFKIGTCHGLYVYDENAWKILSIINDEPGNGHLEDFFEWFIYACKRDNSPLIIQEVWNLRFKNHLIKKRKFIEKGSDCIRFF